MEQLKRLIIPQKVEIILYSVIASCLLMALNIKRFQLVLDGYAAVEASGGTSLGNINEVIKTNLDKYISADILDVIVWLLIGCIGFVVISSVIALVQTTKTEFNILHYYKNPQGRRHEFNAYITKLAVRTGSLITGILWLSVFLSNVLPFCTKLFFTSVTTITDYQSWIWFILTIMITAISLYLFAIALRLIALKSRLF